MKLFGFEIKRPEEESIKALPSFIPDIKDDGASVISAGGSYGVYVDLDGSVRTESELVSKYRDLSMQAEIEMAIDNIINDSVINEENQKIVELILNDTAPISPQIKELLQQEFQNVLNLLEFNEHAYEIYKRWYIDGRLYYHVVIDPTPQGQLNGILKLRYIDPRKIRKVREIERKRDQALQGIQVTKVKNEYYIYNERGFTSGARTVTSPTSGIKIAVDSICHCTSGLMDPSGATVIGYLHSAIKPMNQLRALEDATLIYRICVVGDTRVKTVDGYKYIKDISNTDVVYVFTKDGLETAKVKKQWTSGVKPVFKVSSQHHSIRATSTHPVLVKDSETNIVEYVAVSKLNPKRHSFVYESHKDTDEQIPLKITRNPVLKLLNSGIWSSYRVDAKEKIISSVANRYNCKHSSVRNFLYGQQYFDKNLAISILDSFGILEYAEFDQKYEGFTTNDVCLPDYVDQDFARLFGFLLGDGSVSDYTITFAEGIDEQQNFYYAGLLRHYFSNCTRYAVKGRTYCNYTTNNTIGAELLRSLGFVTGAKNKRIPEWVFRTSKEIRKAFIEGLADADGCIKRNDLKNTWSAEIELCNKRLVEDIKELWTSVGLSSGHIRYKKTPSQTRKFGLEMRRTLPETESWTVYISNNPLKKFEPIWSIVEDGEELVYDIEVDHEKHNFIGNGIVLHNSRAPERRIFYIDVGNLPKVKAEQYLRDMMIKHKNRLVYDSETGCFDMSTKIPLLDGRTLSISEIETEMLSGKILWAYSCDPNTGKFAPGLITWAGETRKNAKVMRLTFDNGKSVTCTLDHKFPVWNKGFVEAKDLSVGESMMPDYKRKAKVPGAKSTYEQIFDNETKKWLFTHRAVSKWKDDNGLLNEWAYHNDFINNPKTTVHHTNYNRYDNCPDNLVRMARDDHFYFHKQHNSLAGKIGGKTTAERHKRNGTYYFNLTSEQRSEIGKKSGKIGGSNSYKNKSGIHGLSKETTTKNSIQGNRVFQQKLSTDIEFRENFCNKLSEGFTDERRNAAAERGKLLGAAHFKKMNKAANIAKWNDDKNIERRKALADLQTIVFSPQIFDLVKDCAALRMNTKDVISTVNKQLDFDEWKSLNDVKAIKQKTFDAFTYKDLLKVCKKSGFKDWRNYQYAISLNNHKIVKIEYLEEPMNVGTITIDGAEQYHDFHTFALDAGVYTKNSIKDDRKFQTMLEDYWLPRREGGRGTEITTLPAGQNLGELSDVEYFQKRLFRSLRVPFSRLDPEAMYSYGRVAEITRDEINFARFIDRLRMRFSTLFTTLLEKQLVLKQIMSPDEFRALIPHIKYQYARDNLFSELKQNDIMQARLNVLNLLMPFIGKYFSHGWIRKNVLKQSDEDMQFMDQEIAQEINIPQYISQEMEEPQFDNNDKGK